MSQEVEWGQRVYLQHTKHCQSSEKTQDALIYICVCRVEPLSRPAGMLHVHDCCMLCVAWKNPLCYMCRELGKHLDNRQQTERKMFSRICSWWILLTHLQIHRETTSLDDESIDRKETGIAMMQHKRALRVLEACWASLRCCCCWRGRLCNSVSEMIIRRLQLDKASHYKHSSLWVHSVPPRLT